MSSAPFLSLLESAKAALEAAETAVAKRARKAVRPVYVNDGQDPQHHATCIFIEVDGQDYLLTCAHVMDAAGKGVTIFVAEKELHGITATFNLTNAKSGKRDDDLLDFAFTPVGPEWRERGIIPLSEDEMQCSAAHFYEAYGYPNSRNGKKTISFTGKKIRPTVKPFLSKEVDDPAVLAAAGLSAQHHLALFRDPESALDGGKKVKPFEPVGMSGGAIFAMLDVTDLQVHAGFKAPRVALAALITHKSPEHKLIWGTRMSTIVAAIRQTTA